MKFKFLGSERTADKMLQSLDKFEDLKRIANKQNYPHKIAKLRERLTLEYKFWLRKGPSPRLSDIEKDINFVSTQQNKTTYTAADKARLDELANKYPID